jgi:hypothetical protein
MYGQQPPLGQNNYNPTGQYPNNQYGTGYYRIILQKLSLKNGDIIDF